MKRSFRILGIILLVLIIAATGLISYAKFALPDVGDPPDLQVEGTPERIERGRYLAHSVAVCMDCHSTRDWSRFSGPIIPGTEGKGGERFDQSMGFPGVYYSRNITPFGVTRYSDGELYRLITTGVTKEGRAIFPVMPYPYYGRMAEEDIYSIIAYLRTLKPLESSIPDSQPDFPMTILLNTIPKRSTPEQNPSRTDELAYGRYMTNAAACIECHTPVEQGQIIADSAFAGGREFSFPDGSIVRSSNITPDEKTGIGRWNREQFVQRFKLYADSSFVLPAIKPGEFNTIMPWTMYATMSEEDLGAIYVYLRSVKAVDRQVQKYTPPPATARVSELP